MDLDMIGTTFGSYTVVCRISIHPDLWKCRCECGRHRNMSTSKILHYIEENYQASCGVCKYHPPLSEMKLRRKYYMVFSNIKSRCNNSNHYAYKNYGGRGIKLFNEWNDSFDQFYDYISKLPHFNEPGRSLDRIDNNKGYEPNNIRWATAKEQANNTRRCKKGDK